MIKRLKNKIKKHFQEVLEIKSSPSSIAAGFAIGTALAILPTFGLGALFGIIIILIFKKVSKLSLLIAFAFWNPLLLIPLAGLSYKIGDILLTGEPIIKFKIELLNQAFIYTRRYIVGNLILTTLFTTISYFVVYFFTRAFQKKQIQKIAKKAEEKIVELAKEAKQDIKEIIK